MSNLTKTSKTFVIQDLPDDILIEIFGRISPRRSYCALRSVCRKWRELVGTFQLFKKKESLGILKPIIFVLGRPTKQKRGSFKADMHDLASRKNHCFDCQWPALCEVGRFPEGLSGRAFVAVGHNVYLLGDDTCTYSYNPVSNSCGNHPPMLKPRKFFAAAALEHEIYVFGGISPSKEKLNSAEVYDVRKQKWRILPDLPEYRSACLLEAANDKLFLIGGQNVLTPAGVLQQRLLIFDPKGNKWSLGQGLPGRRWFFKSCVVSGKLCVTGGAFIPYPANDAAQPCWASPLLYNESLDLWECVGPKPSPFGCDSNVCKKLRQSATTGKVDLVGIGDSIFIVVEGELTVYHFTLGIAASSNSCSEVWDLGCFVSLNGKWKHRLKSPWYGQHSSVLLSLKI